MPDKSSVFRWIREDEGFRDQYTRAKEECADLFVEEMVEICDDDESDVQRSRLRVDTRKWVASKLKPKRYGDLTRHTGADGESPVHVHIEGVDAHL